mgnify:FL=1
MKAIRLHNYGSIEELQYEDIPIPEINDNQVLVKIYATSINHLEIKKASGAFRDKFELKMPWIPGHDFAGVVEKVGKNITSFQVGDKVYGNANDGYVHSDQGSYAEYMAADLEKIAIMPTNLTFVEAASVPHVGETAWQAVHTYGKLKAGEKVLIHGATGAVGAFATQFARQIGAEIYATASAKNKELAESYGADVVLDYRTTDFSEVLRDMDLVLVFTGGDVQEKSYKVLKKGGRLVSITGPIIENLAKEYEVSGVFMVIKQSAKDLQEITKLIESGDVTTDIGLTYKLEEAATAWKTVLGTNPELPKVAHGKVVLEVSTK